MNFLDIFKFELYKLLKSRKMYFIYALAILTWAFAPIDNYVFKHSTESALYQYCSSGSGFFILVLIPFVVVLVSEDFSSGYIKNIYSQVNKVYYILSKVFIIASFCIVFVLFDFLIVLITNAIFGCNALIKPNETEKLSKYLEQIRVKFLNQILGGLAFGTVIAFFTLIIKNAFITFAASYIYGFFGGNLIGSLINALFFKNNDSFASYEIARSFLPSLVVNQNQASKHFVESLIVMVLLSAVFAIGSWFVFTKKQVE